MVQTKRKRGSGSRKTWYYSVILVYVLGICLKDLLNNEMVHLKVLSFYNKNLNGSDITLDGEVIIQIRNTKLAEIPSTLPDEVQAASPGAKTDN